MSKVCYELTPMNSTVKLTLLHEDLSEKDIRNDEGKVEGKVEGYKNGWTVILSN